MPRPLPSAQIIQELAHVSLASSTIQKRFFLPMEMAIADEFEEFNSQVHSREPSRPSIRPSGGILKQQYVGLLLERACAQREGIYESGQSDQIFAAAIQHLLVQSAYRVLFEMRGLPMCIRRGRVSILFVNKNGVGIAFDPVRYVGYATRLLPRCFRQLAQKFGHVVSIFRSELHPNSEADHGERFLPVAAKFMSIRILSNPPPNGQNWILLCFFRSGRSPASSNSQGMP
jgi:hypothetical protein